MRSAHTGTSISFNRSASLLAVADDTGYQVMSTMSDNREHRCVRRVHGPDKSMGGVSLVAMLDDTPIIVLVGRNTSRGAAGTQSGSGNSTGSMRFLQVYDTSKSEVLTAIQFDTVILNVQINRKRLIVILERQTHMFDFETMDALPQIRTTQPINILGLGSLSDLNARGECFYAFPLSTKGTDLNTEDGTDQINNDNNGVRGDVVVMEAMHNNRISVISAHSNSLVALELCKNGTRLVTASSSGSLIKVFCGQTGNLLFLFRRGNHRAVIRSMSFSSSGDLIAALSDSGTLHLFRCDADEVKHTKFFEKRSFAKFKLSMKSDYIYKIKLNDEGRIMNVVVIQSDMRLVAAASQSAGGRGTDEVNTDDLRNRLSQYVITGTQCKFVSEHPFF
eukprot:Tbor_TRINITY_DN4519_c1_g1::TRINITY_DN4519_c1_g1_i1::g.15846::m.15846/K17908/WIPI, ATG18; autophagy-related protein 18